MSTNIWYLVTAIIAKIKHNPSSIDNSVWQLIIAGLVGMVLYIIAFVYAAFWIWTKIPR
jgi:Zn-dependent protease with chaperone function